MVEALICVIHSNRCIYILNYRSCEEMYRNIFFLFHKFRVRDRILVVLGSAPPRKYAADRVHCLK